MRKSLTCLAVTAAFLCIASVSQANVICDVLCYYEQGNPTHGGYWAEPAHALNTTDGVSLGRWSDNAAQGTNDRPVGICLGFSTSIVNGDGDDLKIVGNAFSNWYEPGYVEVARETSGDGATENGWQDETFYLIKPSNYDLVGDPRNGPLAVGYPYNENWSQDVTGYADVDTGSDRMDISQAIDASGAFVSLADIAYVRIRTATDDSAGPFGNFSTEINYVQELNGVVPEPATVMLLSLGSMLCVRKRR